MATQDCANCFAMLRGHIVKNPRAYQALLRKQPGATYNLCADCRPTSRVHAADELATEPDDLAVDSSGACSKCPEMRQRVWEFAAFVLLIIVLVKIASK